MAAGSIAGLELDVVVIAPPGSTISNLATSAGSPADPFAGNNADTLSVLVRAVDLALDLKADDATPTQNEEVAFTVSVTNPGPFEADGVVVHAALPPALAYHTHTLSSGT